MKHTLKIGDLTFEYPFVLAPLAGITDRSMRSLCCQAGASLTYTEMVSAKGLWYGDRKTGELLAVGDDEGPVGFQLFGCEPEILAYAVRLLSQPARAKAVDGEMAAAFAEAAEEGELGAAAGLDKTGPAEGPARDGSRAERQALSSSGPAVNRPPMGARTVAGLKAPAVFDLNAGCPVPKIVRNGEGSALLKDPQLFYDCVSAMCDAARRAASGAGPEGPAFGESGREPAVPSDYPAAIAATPIPVTVKIRKGFERDESCAVEIAKAAEAAGAAAVTVHGRTRQQFYEGKADWDVIAQVKKAVRIPVIGNGDVMTGADAIRMMEETGCDGVMIARGALGNPWIFQEARALWDGCGFGDSAGDGSEGPAGAGAGGFVPPTDEERIRQLLRHLQMVCEDKGERIAVREMRKHVGWYIKGMRGATQIRRQINTAATADEIRRILTGE